MEEEILDISNESMSINNANILDTKETNSVENSEISDVLNDVNQDTNIINQLNNNIDTTTNCLALTIKENYHPMVVKNFFKKSVRVTWKVALSIFTINFLNLFL